MNEILWPAGYLPGKTDNFASNETIVSNLTAEQVWANLQDTSVWESYYENVADIRFLDASPGSHLELGSRFRFTTFGFPIEAEVVECVLPTETTPGRLAWHGWEEGSEAEDMLHVHHAWLIENLSEGRVRVLTQETQNGAAAKAMAIEKPNPMINGHQEWIDGLIRTSQEQHQVGEAK
ncbi:SRPBCC domain-containing protein [Exiguobacterium sp. TBG-PICH-001]|uniref:SRPBCC domain-containing protein n=1 Tax=Exiguobacterium abrahamii TaxID=2785532 RepID=UPI0018A7B963|nr:SRPBCC domain-containing protein [Exiguobacterium sp. TBG-PICH-001]MBF8152838.1 SRPBCC domain-containing protein [Exiguobacterium sp. TBG-PICH-001]